LAEQATENIDFQLALGGGEITGTITDAFGVPVRNLRVVLYEAASGHFVSQFLRTWADGTYSFTGLPTGSYKVYVDTSHSEYIPEYYDDAFDPASATPVVVTDGATTAGIDIMLDDMATDSDGDGIPDYIENGSPCLDPNDADTDDDGIMDGEEDVNHNGIVDEGETDPCDEDTDDDYLQDGTEQGVTTGHPTDTGGTFIPDADPGSTTDPTDSDTDDDSLLDGEEDADHNGRVDPGESDPNVAGYITGTVMDEYGVPIEGLRLEVREYETGDILPMAVFDPIFTQADGSYTYPVPTGNFMVRVFVPNGSDYVDEFYDDALNFYSASPVQVTEGLTTSDIDFHLALGNSISGTVTDLIGDPISGYFFVFASNETLGHVGSILVFSSTQTTYTITGLPPGNYRVTAMPLNSDYINEWYDDAFDPAFATLVPIIQGQDVSGIDFQLALGGSITGTVTDSYSDPVEGVTVYAYEYVSGDYYRASTTSSEDGSYTIRGLPPGDYRVNAGTTGTGFLTEYYDNTQDPASAVPVTVVAEQTTENIDLQLALGGGEITGTVTNPAGDPIRMSLRVVIYDNASGRFISDTRTQLDGAYSVTGLPTGSYKVHVETINTEYVPEYYDNAFDPASATPVAVTDGATTAGIDIMLDDRTTDSDGDGIPDYIENGSPCLDPNDADTDDDGIMDGDEDVNQDGIVDEGETDPCDEDTDDDGLQDGTEQGVTTGHPTDTDVTFIPDADGGATTTDPLDPDSDGDSLLDGEEDADHDGMVDPGESDPNVAGYITGTVTDQYGDPIEGLGIWVLDYETGAFLSTVISDPVSTQADGTYTIPVPTGSYMVRVLGSFGTDYIGEFYDDSLDNRSATPVPATEGLTTPGIDFELALGDSITGNITDSNGDPLSSHLLLVVAYSETSAFAGGSVTIFPATPTYTIQGLPPGNYWIQAQVLATGSPINHINEWYDDALDQAFATPVSVIQGLTTSGIDLQLGLGGVITGTVTDLVENPVEGVQVYAYEYASGEYFRSSFADSSDGTYMISGLPPGDYRVHAGTSNTGYLTEYYDDTLDPSSAAPVPVLAEQITEDIDFQLTLGGGEITGTITDTFGDPIRSLRVVIYEDASGHFIGEDWTQADGIYSVTGLPSGNYQVYVETYQSEYIPEYYDDAPDPGSATPVAVTDGATTTGIDFMLETGDVVDSDGDGLPDAIENASLCLDPNDADTDDDGIIDGDEDVNHDGYMDLGETDPCNPDSDGDGIQDGTELGFITGHVTDTGGAFIPDADGGATTTDPLDPDSDDDGFKDGLEDKNHNGQVDPGESDPNDETSTPVRVMPWIPLLLLNE
jgi:hypothetical protein